MNTSYILSGILVILIIVLVILIVYFKVSSSANVIVQNKLTCQQASDMYLTDYPDIKAADVDPWGHYNTFGKKEGRIWKGNNCKFVTILYSVWADHMMQNNHPIYFETSNPGPGYNWWGKPAYKNGDISEYLFVKNNVVNNELIDYHADLIFKAGIDFITIDLSNGQQEKIIASTHALAKRYSQRDPNITPKIALFVNNPNDALVLRDSFYFNPLYNKNIWFNYESKPLILIAFNPKNTIVDKMTMRTCWGLYSGDIISWTFKTNTLLPGHTQLPYINKGYPEEMSVCIAVQENFMTNSNSKRVGRNNGAYYKQQWENVLKNNPKFVFITAWNEWGSENQGDNKFVDTFGQEYSSDIEPMLNGHGDLYYQMTIDYIKKFKS